MTKWVIIFAIALLFIISPLITFFQDFKIKEKLLKEYKIKKQYRIEILKLSKEIKDLKLRQEFLEENLIISNGSFANKIKLQRELMMLKWHKVIPSLKAIWRDNMIRKLED